MNTPSDIAAHLCLRQTPGRREWRGDCPACGYRATFILKERDGKPLFWCASCQDGLAIATVLRGYDLNFGSRDAAQRPAPSGSRSSGENKGIALDLWRAAQPAAGTPAEVYLRGRSLVLPGSAPLRFLTDCPHPIRIRLPAMLALVTTSVGEPVGIHRTFLRPDGSAKADIEPQKATLGASHGNVVRLHPPGPKVVVGEGIETSLAAAQILRLPALAALTAGSLATGSWLPPGVGEVVIAADCDLSGAGQQAAEKAAVVLRRRGVKASIAMPNAVGIDFNDVLLMRLREGADHA